MPAAIARSARGDVIVFDGSRSHDPEGGLLRYHWDFGDGTTSDIVNPTKTYTRGAVYPVTLTVAGQFRVSGQPAYRPRSLVKVDESPIAEAGPDQLACAGAEVHFDGSASRDSDGVVNRFTWNFGDGSTGGGQTPVHVFGKPADYRVVLTIEGDVIGQCANTNASEMTVKVVEAPDARIVGPGQHRRRCAGQLRRVRLDHRVRADRRLGLGLRRRCHRPRVPPWSTSTSRPAPASPP